MRKVHTWNTMVASSFWNMRLSIACAATDAEYQTALPSMTALSTFPSWRGSPVPTPAMRHTRRRVALPPLKDLACHSPRCQELGSQLHKAAAPACFTAPYLAFFMIHNRKDNGFSWQIRFCLRTRLSLRHTPSYSLLQRH